MMKKLRQLIQRFVCLLQNYYAFPMERVRLHAAEKNSIVNVKGINKTLTDRFWKLLQGNVALRTYD
jgi:hypothetical protein